MSSSATDWIQAIAAVFGVLISLAALVVSVKAKRESAEAKSRVDALQVIAFSNTAYGRGGDGGGIGGGAGGAPGGGGGGGAGWNGGTGGAGGSSGGISFGR